MSVTRTDLEAHLAAAIEAALAAGEYALKARASGKIKVGLKDKNDYVTDVDKECERIIVSLLSERFPSDGIYGEEGDRSSGRGRWVIDPIDGTTNFFRGLDDFCVSIAWEDEQFHPLLGVVYLPLKNRLFHAAEGMGAFEGGKQLHVSSLADPAKALMVCVPPHRARERFDSYWETYRKIFLGVSDIRSFGTCAEELCEIAAGHLDGYYELSLGYYDIAAGWVILHEAGGEIECPQLSDSCVDIIATNAALHSWLKGIIDGKTADL